MKLKDVLVTAVITLLTLAGALGLLRYFAPGLLGVPIDMQMVQASAVKPPFYDNVFRHEDVASPQYIIPDPLMGVRAKPLFPDNQTMGPNDILGFRNRHVPSIADVVVIGDSQTYGNNSPLQLNWPSQLASDLSQDRPVEIYNISVGGWGAIQYLYSANFAQLLQPLVLVVAFYTGNDPLDSYKMAYNYDDWSDLRPDPSLSAADTPRFQFPPPESDHWPVKFRDEIATVFTPRLRLNSNIDHPAVGAGYQIMAEAAVRIAGIAGRRGTPVIFTIIPTKETVFAKKVELEGIEPPGDYSALVQAEAANIDTLKSKLAALEGVTVVDVVEDLQRAAIGSTALYPSNINGHPNEAGYAVIAATLAPAVRQLLPRPSEGFGLIDLGAPGLRPVFIEKQQYWHFPPGVNYESYGWLINQAPRVSARDIANKDFAGILTPAQISSVAPGQGQ